jgi:hypothetical protein
MSVRFISGKPGGGKTLYSVHLIYDELRFGRRNIVTMLPWIFQPSRNSCTRNTMKPFTFGNVFTF